MPPSLEDAVNKAIHGGKITVAVARTNQLKGADQ